jgi:hypothetical protein
MTASPGADDAASEKDPAEVVEEYRDNLSNSRTAPGHHDGKEIKVRRFFFIRSFFGVRLFRFYFWGLTTQVLFIHRFRHLGVHYRYSIL